jgi:hypothetical protein
MPRMRARTKRSPMSVLVICLWLVPLFCLPPSLQCFAACKAQGQPTCVAETNAEGACPLTQHPSQGNCCSSVCERNKSKDPPLQGAVSSATVKKKSLCVSEQKPLEAGNRLPNENKALDRIGLSRATLLSPVLLKSSFLL